MKNIRTQNKKAILVKTLTAISLLVSTFPATLQAASTPDYYKCVNREGGEWNYGRAPQVCAASSFGEDKYILSNLTPIIFQDSSTLSRTEERKRYLTETYALLKELSEIYFNKRKASATATEKASWTEAVLATAAHESYWSHYRKTTDGVLKMMRGDYGHGHGLMQIDDRAHFPAVSNGTAWNIITHATYAMDILYTAWQKADTLSCVKSAGNYWQARTRAAWAQYNGGGAKGCRWTNPNDSWAANDKNFYNILTQRKWVGSVNDMAHKTRIPASCLLENKENCSSTSQPDSNTLIENQLYSLDTKSCVLNGTTLSCVTDQRDRMCEKADEVKITPDIAKKYQQKDLDRHVICKNLDSKLVTVGQAIYLKKNINIRNTPGGGTLGVASTGKAYTVRDFEVRELSGDRYYKIIHNNIEGFIFAGDLTTASDWGVEITSSKASATTLARVNDTVQVTNSVGINQRTVVGSTDASTLLQNIPKGTKLVVEGVAVFGDINKIYYLVTYKNKKGYIYAGALLPDDTLETWAKKI
ncbi:MAG: hypothetical protein ACK41T_01700 [Pseudobdellovibrio sp.]